MTHVRRRNWKADVPREFSAIYRLVLNSGVRFVAYDLPKMFKDARAARDFSEKWNPNPYLASLITPLQVCEIKFREDRLGRYLQRACRTGELRATT